MRSPVFKIMVTVIVLALLVGLYLALAESEYLQLFTEPKALIANIRDMRVLGPIMIIALMGIAIVINPLPSAPIALAAGAVYGHTYGTVYVVAGAELGALAAFAIARWAGYQWTRRFFGETGALRHIGSQNALTALVFFSRLIPFMSFDLVSYAAGLSPIKPWRFAVATLLGLIPVSFALAHFGAEIESGNYPLLVALVLGVGLLTIVPVLLRMYFSRKSETGSTGSDS